MTVVIKSWRPGGTSYLSGTRVGTSGHMDSWSCATIDNNPFSECSWFGSSGPGYITQGCYNGLTDSEKSQCPSLYHGIVADTGHWTPYQVEIWTYYNFNPDCIVECFSAACLLLRPDLAPDPCDDIVCYPDCFGLDYYNTVCDDGMCVQGNLIEENSTECGYIPPEPDPDENITDILMNNKELIILGTVAGIIVLKYM